MECQCCTKNPAAIRICDVEQNEVSEQYNVCTECWTLIKRYLFDPARELMPTSMVLDEVREVLSSAEKQLVLPGVEGGEITPVEKTVPVCPECGTTLAEFKLRGRFGCPKDYEVFAEYLGPLFERIHEISDPRHKGRLPQGAEGVAERIQDLAALKGELNDAIEEENYERAAELRDHISELEGSSRARKEETL